ncbi:MAG: hypothetical protein M3345_07515, partial [Actinomycetota bacterium]|nr:hypothetical protein [Actinomycetota bacterium]
MKRTLALLFLLGALAGCARGDDGFPRARSNLATTPAVTPTGSVSVAPTPSPTESPELLPFRFLALGDFGTGTPEQHAV